VLTIALLRNRTKIVSNKAARTWVEISGKEKTSEQEPQIFLKILPIPMAGMGHIPNSTDRDKHKLSKLRFELVFKRQAFQVWRLRFH
jgi:hypothetical protein